MSDLAKSRAQRPPGSLAAQGPCAGAPAYPQAPQGGLRRTDEPATQMGVQFVLNALRQWWLIATPVGLLLAAAGGAIIYFTFEPVYEASAWIQIRHTPPSLLFRPDGEGSRGSERFVETQRELLRSPMVLGPVLSRPDIAKIPELAAEERPLGWLTGQLQLQAVGRSELFKVLFRSQRPEDAIRLVNAVTDSFFRTRDQDEAGRMRRVIELLDQERNRRESEVKRLREDVRRLTIEATGKDPFVAGSDLEPMRLYPLGGLHTRLVTTQVEREVLEAQKKAFEGSAADEATEVSETMISRAVDQDPQIQGLELRIQENRRKLQEAQTMVTRPGDNPICRELSRKIAQDESTLTRMRDQFGADAQADLQAAMAAQREDQLAQLREQLTRLELTEKALRARYDEERQQVKRGTGQSVELDFKRAELTEQQEVFNLIASRITQLRTEQRAPERVTLLKKADQSDVVAPVESVPYKKLVLAICLGFFAPFGLAIGWERIVRRISDAQSLEQESHLAVLGEIARLPVRRVGSAAAVPTRRREGFRLFEESIDSVRTALVLAEDLQDMKVLAVTSAASNEGKTSFAAQLAVSMARASGQPTLLIDGDLRSPDIHKVFDIPQSPGLAEVLSSEVSLQEAVATEAHEHVHVLPAGKARASPHKLLGNGAFQARLEQIITTYRYVVVDTPPVLAAGEALVLAKAADAAIVCAMRDVSRASQIRKASRRLISAGCRPVGAVLNGIPAKRYRYTYGRYHFGED